MKQRHGWITGVSIGAIVTGALWVSAGELTPPAGPIAPTMKSLETAEPRTALDETAADGTTITIDSGGSYYLTESLNGIRVEITANHVTLDLNGFGLVNAPAPTAISTPANDSITIRNGYITNSADTSINLFGGSRQLVENVNVHGAGNSGIVVGSESMIRNCVAQECGTNGIQAGARARVVDCISQGNTSSGIAVGNESVVTGCTSSSNGNSGISLFAASIAENCVALGNFGNNIDGSDGCVVSNCTAVGSLMGQGITLATTGVIRGCAARSNSTSNGIAVGANCLVHGCSSAGNATDVVLGPNARCVDTITGDMNMSCP